MERPEFRDGSRALIQPSADWSGDLDDADRVVLVCRNLHASGVPGTWRGHRIIGHPDFASTIGPTADASYDTLQIRTWAQRHPGEPFLLVTRLGTFAYDPIQNIVFAWSEDDEEPPTMTTDFNIDDDPAVRAARQHSEAKAINLRDARSLVQQCEAEVARAQREIDAEEVILDEIETLEEEKKDRLGDAFSRHRTASTDDLDRKIEALRKKASSTKATGAKAALPRLRDDLRTAKTAAEEAQAEFNAAVVSEMHVRVRLCQEAVRSAFDAMLPAIVAAAAAGNVARAHGDKTLRSDLFTDLARRLGAGPLRYAATPDWLHHHRLTQLPGHNEALAKLTAEIDALTEETEDELV